MICIQSTICSQNLYFPPLDDYMWETASPTADLGWCDNEITLLYEYLEQQNTKSFIVLKDGKIVLEKYFDAFTKDSLWYWASAGKTLTAFLIGKAQEENYLSISDATSDYLGEGWTNCTIEQESDIHIFHQLTMTSGLDDGVSDNHCTLDTCLNFLSNPGSRWAYHNAPYTLLEKVINVSTGTSINNYMQTKLKLNTGMTGFWTYVDYDNVYFSNAKSMARFGLLIQNNGVWNSDTLLHDTIYYNQMTNTSQDLNLSYGYLWWLNGKESFMMPTLQGVFPGSYAPEAPSDMIAGLGKNGQILSISKSKGIVIVRMGNQADGGDVPTMLCNNIWKKLNAVMCNSSSIEETEFNKQSIWYPNPAHDKIHLNLPDSRDIKITLSTPLGETLMIID